MVEVGPLFEPTVPSWGLTLAAGEERGLLVYRLETKVQLVGDPERGAKVVNEARLETVEQAEGRLEQVNQHLWMFVAIHHLILSQHLVIL